MAHALLLTPGMWHLRASIAALLLGIAIGLVSTHGCAGELSGRHDVAELSLDEDFAAVDFDGSATHDDTGVHGYYSEDVAEFFGGARCPMFVSVCEDFEAGMPSPGAWTVVQSDNTVIGVDEPRLVAAARGQRALHITLPPEPSSAYLRNTSFFPREDGVVWARLFVSIAAPGPDGLARYTVVEATAEGEQSARFGGVSARDLSNALDFDNWLFEVGKLATREDGRNIDRGTWHCMELMFDSVSSEARVYRDGVEVTGARGESPLEGVEWSMPSFDGINIGFAHAHALDRGFDVFIDSVALDDERIGCSN